MRTLRLLNRSEEVTYSRLNPVIAEFGAKVFAKVRLADVFSVSRENISSSLFGFALKSHFDFVAVNSDFSPLFAVEFDGPSHRDPVQIKRDDTKNTLCDVFGFPLLRINDNYVNRNFRSMDLLTYFVETWFLAQAFDEAQKSGSIPMDADFDPSFIITRVPIGKIQNPLSEKTTKDDRFPYWLSCDHQIAIKDMQKRGLIADWVSSCWVGWDDRDVKRCLSWIRIRDDLYAVVKTAMKAQRFPDYAGDLISQLAIFDLRVKIDDILAGRAAPVRRNKLEEQLKDFESRLKMSYRCMGGDM